MTTQKNSPITLSWPLKLGIIAFVLTICAIVLKLLTPPKLPVISTPSSIGKNFDGSTSQFHALTFTGNLPSFPATLPVYTTASSEQASQNIVTGLMKKYALKPHAISKNIWLNDNYSLVKNPTLGTYVFSNSPPLTSSSPKTASDTTTSISENEFVNETIAATTAKQLVTDLGLAERYTLDPLKTQRMNILKGELEPEEDPSLPPTQVEFQFSQKINDYEVQLNGQTENYLKITVNANQAVIRITFPIQSTQIKEAITTTEVLPISQAVEALKMGNGSILNAVGEELVPFDITQISQGTLTAVTLEYRIDTAKEIAYPAYRFTGTLINTSGHKYNVQLITPAIATAPVPTP